MPCRLLCIVLLIHDTIQLSLLHRLAFLNRSTTPRSYRNGLIPRKTRLWSVSGGNGNGNEDADGGNGGFIPGGPRSDGFEDDGDLVPIYSAFSRRRDGEELWRRYHNPESNSMTNILLLLMVLVYISQMMNPNLIYAGNIFYKSLTPLNSKGARINSRIQSGEYYRILTPIFLHGDMLHLMFNCISMGNIAPAVRSA